MKRPLVAVVAMGLLTACAGIVAPGAAKSETPAQSLAATGKAMSQLQSAKFDLAGTATLTLPQQIVDQIQARAGSQASFLSATTTVNFQATGAARRPDTLQATLTAKIGGVTITTEVRALGGSLYYKDPFTSKWEVVTKPRNHAGDHPKLSYQTVLDTAKSLTELGDSTTLNGVSVDHYQVVPDLVRLFAQVAARMESKDPQIAATIEQVLSGVNLTFDVWTGVDDHLIRRLSYDAKATVDLHQLAAADPRAGQSGFSVPAGSIAHLDAHAVINLRDFNAPVTVVAPTVGA